MTERAHAILSASGTKKWATCSMSAALEDWIPEEDSDFSREGTYGHDLGEALLRVYLSGNDGADVYTVEAMMDPEQCEEAAEFMTPPFMAAVQSYVDYVIERIEALRDEHGVDQVVVLLEQRVDFSRWVPQGFGRCDVIIIFPGGVEVIDLKMGAGVYVEGKGNPQLRMYALGAYEAFHQIYDIERVRVTIHQPRKDNVSGDEISVAELLSWAEEFVIPRAALAWRAYVLRRSMEEANTPEIDRRKIFMDAGLRFSPGEHCNTGFCKARFTCSARARYMLEAAQQPYSLAEPATLTVEQLELVVDRARLAVRWLSDCERHLVTQAHDGKLTMAKHKLVEGVSFRTIKDPMAAAKVLMANGYAAADIYQAPALRGLGELERVVGKKKLAELLAEQLEKPPGKLTLAPIDVDKPAIAPRGETAADAFADLGDE